MAWNRLTLTINGRTALTEAQLSGKMNVKSIVVGDGAPPPNYNRLTDLVHRLYEITDIKIDRTEHGYVVTGDLPKVEYDYYFREIGIIVSTQNGDILYVYDNCGTDASHIVSDEIEKRIRLNLVMSDVSEVTPAIQSVLYVNYQEFEQQIEKLGNEKIEIVGGNISKTITDVVMPENEEKYPELGNGKTEIAFGTIKRYLSSLKNDKADAETVAEGLNNKVTKSGGDIADTKVSAFMTSDVSYPVPIAGETPKVFMGKIKKFFEDIRNAATGACFIGQIVNNCVTNNAKLPLSAAQGKVLMDLYTKLNSEKMATSAFNTHKTSGDHDGRYYTSTKMNELLAAKLDTDAHVKSIYINATHSGMTINLDNVEVVVPRMSAGSCIRYMQFNSDLSKLNLAIYHEGHLYNKWIQLNN